MSADAFVQWVFSSVFLSLRVSPMFALAPPFSLTSTPPQVRAILGLGLAAGLVLGHPVHAHLASLEGGYLAGVAVRELFLGFIFVLALQVTFGALYFAGRTLDIQAGYGLATLIDPASNTPTPLVGTLFAYSAAIVFFALDGHIELLRILAATLDAIPIGTAHAPVTIAHLTSFVGAVLVVAMGVAGATVLSLFLADMGIAALARTVPQMNVLVLGFQVKTALLLLVLPTAFGATGALFARLVRMTLEGIPRLM